MNKVRRNQFFVSWAAILLFPFLGPAVDGPFHRAVPDKAQLGTERCLHAGINKDNKADLVDIYHLRPGLRVHSLLSLGDGGWTEVQDDPWPDYVDNDTANWKVSDVNGDGKADLVDMYYRFPGLRVHVLLSHGNGVWNKATEDLWHDYEIEDAMRWQVADINGDRKMDLVTVCHLPSGIQARGLISLGDGTWEKMQGELWPITNRYSSTNWLVSDVTGDGKDDLVNVAVSKDVLRFFAAIARGGGWEKKEQDLVLEGSGWENVVWKTGDINNDHKNDLIGVCSANGKLSIHSFFSGGDGTWSQHQMEFNQSTPETEVQWKVCDLNGDQKTDLLRIGYARPGLCLSAFLSKGDGTWSEEVQTPWTSYVMENEMQWMLADIDGDGRDDLVEITHRNPGLKVRMLFREKDGTWTKKEKNLWDGYALDDTGNWKVAR